MNIEYIKQEAQKRTNLHAGNSSQRTLSINAEFMGLLGEFVFSEFCGVPVDLSIRPKGDKGIDFILSNKKTVDVKTFKKAWNLICEDCKPLSADIYVLAKFNEDNESVNLIGWATKEELEVAPKKDFGYGIVNKYIPIQKLHPMKELQV